MQDVDTNDVNVDAESERSLTDSKMVFTGAPNEGEEFADNTGEEYDSPHDADISQTLDDSLSEFLTGQRNLSSDRDANLSTNESSRKRKSRGKRIKCKENYAMDSEQFQNEEENFFNGNFDESFDDYQQNAAHGVTSF